MSHAGIGQDEGIQALAPLMHASLPPTNLLQTQSWQQIWRGWSRPAQQHDAHEFFTHVQSRIRLPGFDGTWEARLATSSAHEVRDGGTTKQGISIPIPDSPDTLSNCIKDWSLQMHKHALVIPPAWLCVCLLRYTNLPDGGTHKLETAVHFQAGEIIHVPVFETNTTLAWIPYHVTAGVVHVGQTLQEGHYRSYLSEASPGRGNPHGHRFRITDDNTPSQVANAVQNRTLSHQCYMCFLTKLEGVFSQ